MPDTEAAQHAASGWPLNSKREFNFEPDYCGSLSVNDGRLTASFRVPDCLDPPEKKSFSWKEDIVLGERAFSVVCNYKFVPQGMEPIYVNARHSHPRWNRIRLARVEVVL